jgi:hypothetical protein
VFAAAIVPAWFTPLAAKFAWPMTTLAAWEVLKNTAGEQTTDTLLMFVPAIVPIPLLTVQDVVLVGWVLTVTK